MSTPAPDVYHRRRFPPEMVAHVVWLYFRFPLSLRMVEDTLSMRGVDVTHETIRQWAEKFGRNFAAGMRHRWQEALAVARGRSGWLCPRRSYST